MVIVNAILLILELCLYAVIFIGLPVLTLLFLAYIPKKIKQVSIIKKDMGQKLNTILTFLHKNDIDILEKEKFKSYYTYLNKYNFITSFMVAGYSYKEKDMNHYLEECISQLSNEIRPDYSYESDSFYYDLRILSSDIHNYASYKEEMVFISWLLQIIYMKHKCNYTKIDKEQMEVLNLLKSEVRKLKDTEISLDRKEKDELYKAFKAENSKFNDFAKSLYNDN